MSAITPDVSDTGRSTVWIVDDSPLEAEVAARTLAQRFRVEVFHEGHSALEALNSRKPPEVLVLDWMLPDTSGVELCRFIRSTRAMEALPILMLSTRQERRDILEGLTAGADDYLSKPFDAPELVARVNALVRSRQHLERAERAEAALRDMLAHLPDAVVAFDQDGRITFVNFEAVRVLGRAREELIATPVEEVLKGLSATSTRAVDPDATPLADVAIGKRLYSPVIRSLPTVDARSTTIVLRDVTGDRTLASELRTADQRKDEFLAMLGHELRNPLSAMGSAVQLIEIRPDDKRAVDKAHAVLTRQVAHMTRLVDDLLDVSRITRGKIELRRVTLDVVALTRRAIETARTAIEAQQHSLLVTLPDEKLYVDGDPTRLDQAILNLLGNAAKYTAPGGEIRVSVLRDGNNAIISVGDTGMGIPPESLPHIFDLFMQVEHSISRTQGGLGIGLTLVRRLIEMHGGSVRAASEGIGTGSEFTLVLPLAPAGVEAETPVPSRPSVVSVPNARARTVLVVDDNNDVAAMTVEVLVTSGYTVTVAHDGLSALAEVEARHPSVLLLDLGLPGIDGFEVARRLRARTPRVSGPVLVAISGYGQEDDLRRSSEAGFDKHFVKPVDFDALLRFLDGLSWRSDGT